MPKRRVLRHEVTQPLDQSYRLIPLTQGQNAIVNTDDFEWLNQWNWFAQWAKNTKSFYACRFASDARSVRMHREILGCDSKELADHINGNTLDNRRNNLRKCTQTENARNQRVRHDNRCGYRGIRTYRKGHWLARINVDGRRIYLGVFPSAKLAADAYDEAAKKYHGSFARLNFP